MALANWIVSSSAPAVDETQLAGETPADYVLRLARTKALAVRADAGPDEVIVAADTTVVDGDEVLGKPEDKAQADVMLRRLRGHTHWVYTGIAVLDAASQEMLEDICMTEVPMRRYEDAEIRDYIASGDPMDKAGAYGIQHPGFHPVESIAGCYASVMGMPLCHLLRLLARLRRALASDLPARCQAFLHYDCPVSPAILRGEAVG